MILSFRMQALRSEKSCILLIRKEKLPRSSARHHLKLKSTEHMWYCHQYLSSGCCSENEKYFLK